MQNRTIQIYKLLKTQTAVEIFQQINN